MNDVYIIINNTVLQNRIEELEKELAYHKEWYEKARANYDSDRKIWGHADDGEMRVASDAAFTTAQEIKILKQIISQSTPLIPEIDKAYWAGMQFVGEDKGSPNEYISNLKLDI